MQNNQFVYYVPPEDFSLDDHDIKYLENLVATRLSWTTDWLDSQQIYMKSGFRQWKLDSGHADEYQHPLFAKIADYGGLSLEYVIKNSQLSYIPAELNIHVDHRVGAFTIPLVDLNQPLVYWNERGDPHHVDNKKPVYSHYHKKYEVTILNSLQPHSVIDNKEERILFQVNWPVFPFE